MSKNWYYVSGGHNATCDRCGEKNKSDDLRKEWTGLMVCHDCWEMRHPQDFLRTKADKITPEWIRPIIPEVHIDAICNIIDEVRLSECILWQNEVPPLVETDSVSLSENVVTTSQYYRIIPLAGDTTNGVLNGVSFNSFSLNDYNVVTNNTTEAVTLSESVTTSIGYTKTASDSLTLSESVSTFKYISNPLNVPTLNSIQLG